MAIIRVRVKKTKIRASLWLTTFTLLLGCSVDDTRRLFAPSTTAVLIQSKDGENLLSLPAAGETFTEFNSARLDSGKLRMSPFALHDSSKFTVHVDPTQLPVTPSQSLAVETQLHSSPFVLRALPRNKELPGTPLATINLETLSPPVEIQLSSIFPFASSLEQAQKTLIKFLAIAKEHPERLEKLFAEAEVLAKHYPNDELLQSLWQQLSRYSDWQPVNSIIAAAGIDFISVKGWQPESSFMRTRKALLPPVADNEQVIFADQRLVLLMTNLAAINFGFDARLEDIPFLPEVPTQISFQVDELPIQSTLLADKDDWRHFTLAVPKGEHVLRFFQQKPIGNQYVKLRFNEAATNMAIAQERPYFISTKALPLEIYSQGPAVIRIDELNEGVSTYRYQNIPEGWQSIRLPPTDGKLKSLLRVSQRVLNLHPEPLRNRIVQRELVPVPAPDVVLTEPVASKKVALIDAFTLGKQQDGTMSAGFDLVRRNNQQESGATLPPEQFSQYRLNYRYYDEPRDTYWNTLGFFRARQFGGPSFGVEEFVYFNPDWLPFTVRSNAKVVAQVPQDQLEALAQWDLFISNAYQLHPKTQIIPSVNYFARTMSLNKNSPGFKDPNFKQKVDLDVFTPYKSEHTQGLNLALTLEHRPWLDTIWSGKVAAGSNEDLNFTRPDFYRTEAHWQQLLGSVELDAFYRMTFYQADADRNANSKRSYTGLELNWQKWTAYQDRFEVSALYTYDLERAAHLGTLSFTYHFGEGRGYRDFAPNEFNFRDIRQRQIVDEENNVMRDVP